MNSRISTISLFTLLTVLFLSARTVQSQRDTERWKVQFAVGLNYPNVNGFVPSYFAKSVNFPTLNIGVQHLFSSTKGVKLDMGFNRFSNADGSEEFKTNYTRINAQFVYDSSTVFEFLPQGLSLVGHAGPGISFIKPLGNFGDNSRTFLNIMGGLELHIYVVKGVTLYTDASYVFSFPKNEVFDPPSTGFGTFDGNLFTLTFGVSVSLGGCLFCE